MRSFMEVDKKLGKMFDTLHDQPARDPQKAAAARLAFLSEAGKIAAAMPDKSLSEPVSHRSERRHILWMQTVRSVFTAHRKERSPMFGTFGTIFLIITILFGGGGVTVAAAQDSMPDQALYPVKTWSESVRAQMTTGEMNQLRLALELAERRAEEMQMMFRAGQTPPQAVQNQWEGQLDEALRLAAGLTHDPQFQAHLEKVQSMAQVQQQTFKQVGPQKDPAGEALLTRTQAKLGEILMMCKQGQQDPNAFQHMVQNMQQKQARDGEPASEQNQEQNQEQNGEPAGSQNQEQNQEQNGEHAGDQNQEQNQEQHQYQECTSENGCKGPYGPGEGAGPGPGDGAGDGSGTGVGSGGSGSDDSGSDNTGGSNAGSGSTGSDDTGGDASGSESNGSGETGGSGGGNGGGK